MRLGKDIYACLKALHEVSTATTFVDFPHRSFDTELSAASVRDFEVG